MKQKRTMKALLAGLAVILVVLICVGLACTIYESSNVFIGDGVYPKNAKELNLRDREIPYEDYLSLKEAFPDCPIHWNVPFQGKFYPEDTESLEIFSLTEQELDILDCFTALKTVNAMECDDYDALQQLESRHPDCDVQYQVQVGMQTADKDCQELTIEPGQADREDLEENLPYLKNLKTLHFEEPELKPEDLTAIREAHPELTVTWNKTVFGASLGDDTKELDISGMKGITLEEIKEQTAYLPALKKLIMSDCGFDNDTMYDFREEMRPHYKVVWTVQVGPMRVRTDETWFMPTKYHMSVLDNQIDNLYYCEDMICVDVGHHPIRHVDWVAGMPHIKYLIVADGPLRDITPIGQLKEVVWLELFMTDIRDVTPLLGCTALEDLNLARIPADLKPIAEMKWVKNLWISGGWVPQSTVSYLRENMPNTYIDASGHHNCCGRGWRQLQNYYDMRDIVGMPYFLD